MIPFEEPVTPPVPFLFDLRSVLGKEVERIFYYRSRHEEQKSNSL